MRPFKSLMWYVLHCDRWVKALNEPGIALMEGVPCEPGMVKKVREDYCICISVCHLSASVCCACVCVCVFYLCTRVIVSVFAPM